MTSSLRKPTIEKAVKAIQYTLAQNPPKPISGPSPVQPAAQQWFTGSLRGTEIPFTNMPVKQVNYVKQSAAQRDKRRAEFEERAGGRERFLKAIAGDPEKAGALLEAGIGHAQIALMKEKGKTPQGWQVHHKLPLDGGGTSEFDNLVLIKNGPYNQTFTRQQNEQTHGLQEGEARQVSLPIPDHFIYPAKKP